MEPTNLEMLIKLAITSRNAAAGQLAHTRHNLTQAQAQLDALHGYANEYSHRAHTKALDGLDAAARANWHAFDGKLDRAIAQQKQEIERRRTAVDTAEHALQDMQKQVKSLEALAQRQREIARHHTERREQKHMDELAARSTAHTALSRPTEHPNPELHW